MPSDCITYQDSGYFSPLMNDYLNEKPNLKALYNRFPKLENFENQMNEKRANFNNRTVLVEALEKQNSKLELSSLSSNNIQLLKENTTFTITTGHQLNLFTGPLYFFYKIISTINLCKELKVKFPKHNFVPVYWMATEDHDFDEINYFNFLDKKVSWKTESKGPVGRLSTDGLDLVYTEFEKLAGKGDKAEELLLLFKKSYVEQNNLTDATRFLVNELFKEQGLVIIDGDDISLKKLFIPFTKKEVLKQDSFQKLNETLPLLKDYSIQVNPREINLFYIEDTLRERIVFEDGKFQVLNTQLSFSESEILALLENNPEKFSPNVILRPLYQEVILPNLCYIGGGGELAYWLELKSNFESNGITFPMLLLRNSVLLVSEKQQRKLEKLNISKRDLFLNQDDLLKNKTKELSEIDIDFSTQKDFLKKQFEDLYAVAKLTDASFLGAVAAQEKKQIKGLENLEKRLLKAQKRKLASQLEQISNLQNELFPKQRLQERKANFSEFYLDNGPELINKLLNTLKPLEQEFTVLVL